MLYQMPKDLHVRGSNNCVSGHIGCFVYMLLEGTRPQCLCVLGYARENLIQNHQEFENGGLKILFYFYL